jgi:Xaa-Pro aminopeptidase
MTDTSSAPTIAGIPVGEYATRVDRARAAATDRGLDGFIVVGRGGGPFERHANLQYLTGHYPTFPTIPDVAGRWELRGHAEAIVGPERVVLISDELPHDLSVAADAAHNSSEPLAEIERAVRECGLEGRRIGLVGSDVLPMRHAAALVARIGQPVAADDLLDGLRAVKSPAEQALMRAAGLVGSVAITAALAVAEVGATVQQATAAAYATAVGSGAAVANCFAGAYGPGRPSRHRAFPAYADDAPMRDGDVFVIDFSGALDGYFFDFSRSRVVGEDRHGGDKLLSLAQGVVEAALDTLRPGATVADVARAGNAVTDAAGMSGRDGGFDGLGHGLGLGFEDPWVTPDNDTLIQAGMCIAIERFIEGDLVCAAFEHDVIVTDGPPEILSVAPDRFSGA